MSVVVRSGKNGPSIITEGLIFIVDPLNTKSYSGSGTDLYDLSSYNNTSTLSRSNICTTTPGVMTFVASSSDRITPSDNLMSKIGTGEVSYALEAWINLTSNPTGVGTSGFSIIGHAGSGGIGLQVNYNTYTRLNFGYRGNSNFNGDVELELGTWYHVVGTRDHNDSTENRIYVNGELDTSKVADLDVNTTTADLQIGDADTRINNFNGIISLVKVYNKNLSASEIKNNFNAQKSRFI